MTRTLDDFCRERMGAAPAWARTDPVSLADAFVRFFGLSLRPTLDELTGLLRAARIGTVLGAPLSGSLRGVHYSAPGGGYDIHYREDQWAGAQEHTVLHETYEIICETLGDLYPGSPLSEDVCREADRFAASVLMQPAVFAAYAEATGLDVVALQKRYGRAYASVTLRLAEVMRDRPLLAVLYERQERGGPSAWDESSASGALRVKAAARTPGFGAADSRLLDGSHGGVPGRGWPPSPGSAAERVAHAGRAAYAEEDNVAVAARPVFWQGRLAKVAVVAVPYHDRAILWPQLAAARFDRLIEDQPAVGGAAPTTTVAKLFKSRPVSPMPSGGFATNGCVALMEVD